MRIFLDNNGVSTLWSQFKDKLAAHADDSDIHVTAEEKAAWDGKAELTDIPTSLPANGGNSETVNNQNVEMSIYRNMSSLGVSSSDTADTVWKAIPPNSIFAIEASTFTDPSWNFPEGTNQYSLLMIKLSNVRPLGMYLYPKSGGNVFFANVDVNGAYAGNWRRLCDGGDAATLGTHPASDFVLNSDFNTHTGNAEIHVTAAEKASWDGKADPANVLRNNLFASDKDCNDCTNPGWYSFNGCRGHAPGSNSTINSGTYFILLNVPMSAAGYFVQIATFVHGSANYLGRTYIRYCNNGVWTEWENIADGGDAATLGTHPASDFLYANGFAGQLAKLFSKPANDTELATVFSVAPDDATLDTLNPGIYVVNTSAARKSLKIPNEIVMGGPNGATVDNSQCVGGILIKLGSILGKPGVYITAGGTAADRPYTTSCAFFISNNGSIYRAIESINQRVNQTGAHFYAEWTWQAFVFDSFSDDNIYSIQSIKYINTDITLAPGAHYAMYAVKGMYVLPYTSGAAYGPTKGFPLKPAGNSPDLCIINTSDTKDLIIPAGRYLIHVK